MGLVIQRPNFVFQQTGLGLTRQSVHIKEVFSNYITLEAVGAVEED